MKINRPILLTIAPLALVAGFCSQLAYAQGSLSIEETITGNQEQPKVLYIVPWKTAADNEVFEQTISSQLLGSVFEHVERAELRREVLYLEKLAKDQESTSE